MGTKTENRQRCVRNEIGSCKKYQGAEGTDSGDVDGRATRATHMQVAADNLFEAGEINETLISDLLLTYLEESDAK